MEGDKFSIGWSTFHNHLLETSNDLYHHKNFTDVTLVSDDLVIMHAHRFVLSSSSSIFQKLLSIDSCPKPILFLKGVTSQELESILQFIYLGETRIDTDRINSFLVSAKNLAIKKIIDDGINPADFNPEAFHTLQQFKEEVVEKTTDNVNENDQIHEEIIEEDNEEGHETNIITSKENVMPDDNPSLQKNRMDPKDERKREFVCEDCPYKALTRNSLRIHVKSIHLLERHPCNQCKYQATQKANLNRHMKISHADSWGHKM